MRIFLVCLFLIISLNTNYLKAEGSLIYVVDLPKVVNESKLGKSAQLKIRAKAEEAQASMAKAAQELRALEEKLQKQSSVLSASALEDKRAELVDRQKDFARAGEDKQSELQTQNRKYMGEVLKEVKAALDEIGKEKKYPIIIEKDQKLVLYADSKIDISAEVIQKLDSKKSSL